MSKNSNIWNITLSLSFWQKLRPNVDAVCEHGSGGVMIWASFAATGSWHLGLLLCIPKYSIYWVMEQDYAHKHSSKVQTSTWLKCCGGTLRKLYVNKRPQTTMNRSKVVKRSEPEFFHKNVRLITSYWRRLLQVIAAKVVLRAVDGVYLLFSHNAYTFCLIRNTLKNWHSRMTASWVNTQDRVTLFPHKLTKKWISCSFFFFFLTLSRIPKN